MRLFHISEHTVQINAWIGLCQLDDSKYPNDLRKAGYVVDSIDPKFVQNGNEVNPDLILTSRSSNHSLVIDAKTWFLKEKHHKRYSELKNEPRVLASNGFARGVNPETFLIDFTYSSFNNLSENGDYLPEQDLSIVHFNEDELPVLIDTLDEFPFDADDLKNRLPIKAAPEHRVPTDYYPFDAGIKEDEQQFILSLLQATMHLALEGENFTAKDLMEEAHPLWVDMDTDKKEEFLKRTEELLGLYSRKGLSSHIEKVQERKRAEWKVVSKNFQALQRKLDEFIEEAEKKLRQTSIQDFT